MAGLPGDSIEIARKYMDSLLVKSRIVGAVRPTTRFEFLGRSFETPIMTAALSHLDLVGMAEGAKQAGAPVSIGMGETDELEKVLATGAGVMKIIKPYADPDAVYQRIAAAEKGGAMAVGMDVEHAVNVEDAGDSSINGIPMKLPTLEELKGYIGSTRLPFFIKGALSAQDARRCAELGGRGIILSHHNGLMRFAVPPVMVLPEVKEAVGSALLVIVDGGIASGYDAFKALALGADAVTVGRPLIEPLKERGAEGVRDTLKAFTGQLQAMMLRTGTPDLQHMDPTVIWAQ